MSSMLRSFILSFLTTARHTGVIFFLIAFLVLFLTKCVNEEKKKVANERGNKNFTGSAACIDCHKKIYDDHITTRHYLTSGPASGKFMKGSFESGHNTFLFNSGVLVRMEKRQDGFYQVVYLDEVERRAERFDIAIGSGTKGQTYLHWNKNELAQLPLTYFTSLHQWSNSPGYPEKLVFNRPITSRCLECHSTFIKKISGDDKEPEEFDHSSIIYGVDCEKCHGSGAEHIEFYKQHPTDTSGKFIINTALFTRQQKLDMCALCHGGRLKKTEPSFSFQAGDKLSDYFVFDTVGRDPADIDVHGNQYGLLAASKCFTNSKTMTCITCHDPHKNERNNLVIFSQRCMNCHDTSHGTYCKMAGTLGSAITNHCIDCHMPELPSRAIMVLLQGSTTPVSAYMRSHYIKIYPEQTAKTINLIKNESDQKTKPNK